MARLVLEQPCEHDKVRGHTVSGFDDCRGGSRTVITLDALPSHRIEAAARAICDLDVDGGVKWADLESNYSERLAESTRDEFRHVAESAVRAFLETENKEDSE